MTAYEAACQRLHRATDLTTFGFLSKEIIDRLALDAIAALMSGEDWSADTLDGIAQIICLSGRTIEDTPEDPDDEES